MIPNQAAAIIGCSPQQVRTLIRNGTLPATKLAILGGFVYEIAKKDVVRYARTPQKHGWPRGMPRKRE